MWRLLAFLLEIWCQRLPCVNGYEKYSTLKCDPKVLTIVTERRRFTNFSSTLLNAETGKSDKPNRQTKEVVGEESFLRAKQLLKIRRFLKIKPEVQFTRTYRRSLAWTRPIQSTPSHSNPVGSIIMLSPYIRPPLPNVSFLSNNFMDANYSLAALQI
jgi:hypothetical protein